MSEAIDESVCSLVEELGSRCPGFAPAIFPTSFTPRTLEDLCSTEEQCEAVQQMWHSLNGFDASSSQGLVFRTTIDYRRREIRITSIEPALSETDCLLGSLERSMELIVAGAPDAVTLARQRFSALNEPTHGEGEGEGESAGTSRRFAEAYNLAYAIKVLVSNTPMRMLLGPRGQVVVPLVGGREDFGEALGQVLRRSPRPSGDSDDDDEDEGGEGQGDGAGAGSGKKRRKKKRSGGGGGGGGKGRGN